MPRKVSEDKLHKAVCDLLIEATPEWWEYAQLEIRRDTDGIYCSVSNPKFPHDIVEPHDELTNAIEKVIGHLDRKKSKWVLLEYEVQRLLKGKWSFAVSIDYA